jgi:hypothetical protein
VNPVFLHLAGRYLVERQIAKEREQMNPQPDRVALGPFLGALTFRDNAVFLEELIGRFFEGRAVIQHASLAFALQAKIPCLGGLGRQILNFLLGAELALLVADRRPRLPEA